MSALALTHTARAPKASPPLNGQQSAALNREGHLDLGNGSTVHRPTRDVKPEPEPEAPAPGQYLTPAEAAAVATSCKPLAALEAHQRELAEAIRDAYACGNRSEAPKLQAKLDYIEPDHARARGTARVAILKTIDSAATRAGARYAAACAIVAEAAAELEALATLGDELASRDAFNAFDALNTWQRCARLPAPPPKFRPSHARVMSHHSLDVFFAGDSAAHRETLRRMQAAMRAQLQAQLAQASWPF